MKEKNLLGIDSQDWTILKKILSKYDATFYAFGSRTTDHAHKFSDLDLCVCGIQTLTDLRLELTESDLPIKVDVHNIDELSSDFLKLIETDFILIQASKNFLISEKAILQYLQYIPGLIHQIQRQQKATLIHGEDNMVCEMSDTTPSFIQNLIQESIAFFQKNDFFLWVGPATLPNGLEKILKKNYSLKETIKYIVFLKTKNHIFKKEKSGINIIEAKKLSDFLPVLKNNNSRDFYKKITSIGILQKQRFFIAYEKDFPVAIGILYLENENAVIQIYTEKHQQKELKNIIIQYLVEVSEKENIENIYMLASELHMDTQLGFTILGKISCLQFLDLTHHQ